MAIYRPTSSASIMRRYSHTPVSYDQRTFGPIFRLWEILSICSIRSSYYFVYHSRCIGPLSFLYFLPVLVSPVFRWLVYVVRIFNLFRICELFYFAKSNNNKNRFHYQTFRISSYVPRPVSVVIGKACLLLSTLSILATLSVCVLICRLTSCRIFLDA